MVEVRAVAYDRRKLVGMIDELLSADPRMPLPKIARELGVERHTIEKAVRHVRRMSFREHRQEKLLERALFLLNDKRGFTEKEVAAELGFASLEAFIRFIKAQTGTTPKEIRNRPSHTTLDSES